MGAVLFVPLIGEQDGPRTAAAPPATTSGQARAQTLPQMIARRLSPCLSSRSRIRRLFDRFGDRRIVLLGEASHGTSEFYRARAAITRRLIEEHGFTIVAVEADWPDAAAVDR